MILRDLYRRPEIRRLGTFLVLGVVLAIITGPEGRVGHPEYSLVHSVRGSHLVKSLLIGLAAWAVITGYLHEQGSIERRAAQAREAWLQRVPTRQAKWGLNAVLLAAAILVPLNFGPFWQEVLVDKIAIYALLALGLNVVVGFAGLLDLGYIAFYAIGAYITAYFTNTLPVAPPFTLDPFFIVPLAVAGAMFAGLILGAPTLRLRGDYLAIVTLGFGEIITILAVNLNGVTNGSRGAFGIPAFSVDLHKVGLNNAHYTWANNRSYYYLTLAFVIVVLVLFSLVEDSKVGRAWTAIREDEVAAQACGIPTTHYKLMAFAIGASTSGLAGVIYATKISFINPSSFTVSFSILVLVMVIFGGMGSLYGAIVGAILVQGGIAMLQKHNWIDPADTFIYIGAILIVMMIFRPQGIVPSRRRAREIGLSEIGMGGADATGAPAGGPSS